MKLKVRKLIIFFGIVFLAMAGTIQWGGPMLLEFFYAGKYSGQFNLLIIYSLIYVFEGLNAIITHYLKALGMIGIGINVRKYLLVVNLIILVPLTIAFKEFGVLIAMMFMGVLYFLIILNQLFKKEYL